MAIKIFFAVISSWSPHPKRDITSIANLYCRGTIFFLDEQIEHLIF